ncbi:uncharacterized protein SPAPADRAFT_61159 [Spathaspora passalidarum NRRL Y-27907]|uniref:Uncharacterized protein n=1 Tax=Spathaspora passalidarum (strain NRRL Y-27907 / 11-Y1) TaxID=619300 RepID=G3AP43_SPAPN|nr:uncharacterized protein SPAPADRAFT_61159 [Spathaspora passalidarum NRRL Y-27907]EGW32074.1 hypothetical protein SPAPADRAFT_61159 [Spathaspora passalidarum NRRL Y-27907]
MHDLESCINACTALMNDPGLVKLQATEKTEITRELQYLRWFLGYLVLLQEEEYDIKTNTLSKLFEYLYQFVNDLVNGTSYEDAVELLTRSIQCIVGLLIRAKENDTEISIMEYGTFKPSVFLSEYIIPRVNKLIDFLDSKLAHKMRLTKLAKLWKFHLTFIGNNSKAVNYAKIHAQVPGFQDKCPVIHEEQETSNIPIKQEFTRCPISQITSPQDLEIEKPRKRKCPFDHQSVRSSPAPFTESNLRGDKCPYVPPPPSASTRTTSPLRPIAPAIPTQLPQLSPPPPPPPPSPPARTPSASAAGRAPAPRANPPVIIQPVVPAVPESPNEVMIVNNEFEDMFDFSQFADLDLDFLINENFTEVI